MAGLVNVEGSIGNEGRLFPLWNAETGFGWVAGRLGARLRLRHWPLLTADPLIGPWTANQFPSFALFAWPIGLPERLPIPPFFLQKKR